MSKVDKDPNGTNSAQDDTDSTIKPKLSVKDIEELLGKPVSHAEIKNLTAAGDNYGSDMFAIDVTLQSGEILSMVAKMFPKNEMAQKMFRSELSMKKEIDMYQLVRPEYEKIQDEESIPPSERLHVMCKCPGARLTIGDYQDDQLADKTSVLLLENLKLEGYTTVDRTIGLDLAHTKLALRNLARFQATAVAIKLKKPEVFKSKVLRACTPFKVISKSKEEYDKGRQIFIGKLRKVPAFEKYIESIADLFKKCSEQKYSDDFGTPLEPFATIQHKDFWGNNMMFKYSDDNQNDPVGFQIVDFQTCHYGSPVPDIILFLFTSTQTGVVEENFDTLLKLYHSSFFEWLEMLGCDTGLFSWEAFLKEVDAMAPDVLDFILTMLKPITLSKEDAKKYTRGPAFDNLDLNDTFVGRATTVINIFTQKGWLQ